MGKVTGRPTGVRLTKRQAESTREKIRASLLAQRLELNALGELDPPMSQTQVRSAEILLNKTLSNLQSTEVTSYQHGPKAACDMTDDELAEAIAAGPNVETLKG